MTGDGIVGAIGRVSRILIAGGRDAVRRGEFFAGVSRWEGDGTRG